MDEQLIKQLTPESIGRFLDEVYQLKDKSPKYDYVIVNKPTHEAIVSYLFPEGNKYKVRIEELAGMKYRFSMQWNDIETPKAIISTIDAAKIAAVYTDYEGNAFMIEDLFDSKILEWQKNN